MARIGKVQGKWSGIFVRGWLTLLLFLCVDGAQAPLPMPSGVVEVVSTKGRVRAQRSGMGSNRDLRAGDYLAVGDTLQTGDFSEATLRFSDRSLARLDELTQLALRPSMVETADWAMELIHGGLFVLNQDGPMQQRIRTPSVSGMILGAEAVFRVSGDGVTHVVVYAGKLWLHNEWGEVTLETMEESTSTRGRAPSKLPLLDLVAPIQWTLHYPAVVDIEELELAEESRILLTPSLAAYRAGDLHEAIRLYPNGWSSPNEGERTYWAALSLAAAQVERAEMVLQGLTHPAAKALRRMISVVQGEAGQAQSGNGSPSLSLAESFVAQVSLDLEKAHRLALEAVQLSPNFAFGHARLAQLEFRFGRTKKAEESLAVASRLAPRHATALMMQGFLSSSLNRHREAEAWFDRAVSIEPDLGDAWLGRGACRIRRGDTIGGYRDLQVAVSMGPNRSVARSYLAKAYAAQGDVELAETEMERARLLNFFNPTGWHYGAILHQQQYRFNEAVEDLELAKSLNERRNVYRSIHVSDQDLAMRTANLASVFQDVGMEDWGVREAGRAVQYDYTDGAAHLFLASSLDQVRDMRGFDIRLDAPWENQKLMADLLLPVGAGSLSRNIALQHRPRWFERDGMGISSFTEYRGQGDWLERGSQHGVYGGMTYALDIEYYAQPGFAPNTDRDRIAYHAQFKQQIGARDQLLVHAWIGRASGGDPARYTHPENARPEFRYRHWEDPGVLLGWNHEWSAEHRSLLVAGHRSEKIEVMDPEFRHPASLPTSIVSSLPVTLGPDGMPSERLSPGLDFNGRLNEWTTEFQHVMSLNQHTLLGGARFQQGDMNRSFHGAYGSPTSAAMGASEAYEWNQDRQSLYIYDIWEVNPSLHLMAGLGYEWAAFSAGDYLDPGVDGQRQREGVAHRLGFQWSPSITTHVRGAWTRSTGGGGQDLRSRLEPGQVAGFPQIQRGLLPDSLTGTTDGLVPGTQFESVQWGVDRKFRSRTYVGLVGEWLRSDGDQTFGVPASTDLNGRVSDFASIQRRLDYDEKSIHFTGHQFLNDHWTLGFGYRFSASDLKLGYTLPTGSTVSTTSDRERADLHRVDLWLQYADPSGWFTQLGSRWHRQGLHGDPQIQSDDFLQVDIFAGYRWWQRRMELRLGILNLTDTDYRLSPLSIREELPRQRMFYGSFRFQF